MGLTHAVLNAIVIDSMQHKDRLQNLSRLRQDLRHLLEELEETLQVGFERTPLVKGNVYEMARQCGKPTCVCTRGRLHRTMVLSWSEEGKNQLRSIPKERVQELSRKSQDYLRLRRARAQVSVIHKKILAVLDRIQELRREEL